jgi:hypothetical protein
VTNFSQFAANCKTRHDYDDMIQVRFSHPNGELFETWVSGEEVLQRLRSEAVEKRLRGFSQLDLDAIRKSANDLPDLAKDSASEEVTDRLADEIEDLLGTHIISESLADAIRGSEAQDDSEESESKHWLALLHDDRFRLVVLELAWIQLEGSFPEEESRDEPDDWI